MRKFSCVVFLVSGSDYRVLVKRIAIAGGIGAGKTVLTNRLRAIGFDVVDADEAAQVVTAEGTPARRALRDAFGDAVLGDDGSLERQFIADVVFNDPSALRRLNSITHGRIGVEILRQLSAAASEAVFLGIPLFRAEHRAAFSLDEVWAVLVNPETAVRRLIGSRGFKEEDARARLASQMTNDERSAIVDRVMWNEGTPQDLFEQLDGALRDSGLVRG